ncbi:hypothetical protein AZ34_11865 [Hylemonella gracilis str. Niagara R]|uniref:Phage tail protein n=1 Tax=Hylemonella gracilis str. Niagara R TaxID=1458275 RepID=A0A016XLV6_9BURK|nr:phage tail tube protein [Hylemonella gracilis]EYC52890.1 hypothetical protein AZ34_11865 [Hylemonella gracilis str. Niagara R]
MSKKLLGRAFVRVNGNTLASLPGTAKLRIGGMARTPINGDSGYLGYTEKFVNSEISLEYAVDELTDPIALNDVKDAVVTFEADTGQVWVIRNATASGAEDNEVSSGEGKATIKFFGDAAQQV